MPILSTSKLSKGGKALLYHESGGSIINPKIATRSDFIESGGVYFIKMFVPKKLRQRTGGQPDSGPPSEEGFARPGAAQ